MVMCGRGRPRSQEARGKEKGGPAGCGRAKGGQVRGRAFGANVCKERCRARG